MGNNKVTVDNARAYIVKWLEARLVDPALWRVDDWATDMVAFMDGDGIESFDRLDPDIMNGWGLIYAH